MPRLRILAGPSTTDLKPILANSGKGADVSSELFEGQVAVYIKNFAEPDGNVSDSAYFEHEDRKSVTWSIQVQGRFLQEHVADDILFGNVFDRPLPIPWGFSTILSFMQYLDPTLEHDLTSRSKPWALSPLISTMPYFAHTHVPTPANAPSFPPTPPLREDTSRMKLTDGSTSQQLEAKTPAKRRTYFRQSAARKNVRFGPEDILTADFCYGYLSFSPTGVALQIPGGFSLDLMRYWDGQPIYFVCCERSTAEKTETGRPLGKVFWCVVIEVLEGEGDDGDNSEDEDEDSGEVDDDVD